MQPANQRFSADATQLARRHLAELAAACPGISLALLTSGDGFEIAAHPPDLPIPGRLAAMSSALQALSEAITRETGLGNSRTMIIESSGGTILVLGLAEATPPVALAVVASDREVLGQLLWATRNCCKSLERALQS